MTRKAVAGVVRAVGVITTIIIMVVVVMTVAGFVNFAGQVATDEVSLEHKADGIVVLTGAASRIPDAIELLSNGSGRRLLITGVHPATSTAEVARLTPLHEHMFACCIDLDRSAQNTFGNAIETRRWAAAQNFNSLIVVTSNWHMPRAMAELRHQMPDVRLVPFPVVSEKARTSPWWSDSASFRLMLSEYFKYLFALLRMQIDPDFPG